MGRSFTLVTLMGVAACGGAEPSGRAAGDVDADARGDADAAGDGEPVPCEVTTTDPCPSGTYCVAGACTPGDCVHFFAGGCSADQQCAPIGNGAFTCIPVGFSPVLASCSDDLECVAGALCLRGACRAPECSPFSAYRACDGGQSCSPVMRAGEALDIGLCE